MKSDADICRDVVEELRWTPIVDEKDIAAKVSEGVVTLTGFVKSLDEAHAAERAVKRVFGVRALANDLIVRLPSAAVLTDPEIARHAATAVERELPHSAHLVRIVVHEGCVTLDGMVDWQYQKERAEGCIRRLSGVASVINQIALKGKPVASDIKERIGAAIKRSAQLDAERINVAIDGAQVTLTGHVRSWSEHEAAAETAWAAPGVLEVKNYLCVGP
ncbi:MAG: BON domain-containing protein [Gammaproteobacteria bacterium]